ncbi:hypothetical protein EB796_021491 [Bugula neritina]|uniref:Guanylate cyclase n=1 Tax=Bugula neritina TaxID=10212 RepID=A0A7J7J3I0_BUGNE|nr:hypothetical protein EB796_021491 [Bugula neritina]
MNMILAPTATTPMSRYEQAALLQERVSIKQKWPADTEINNDKENIVIGYITSGDVTNRHLSREGIFSEPQSSFFNDGALTVALEEINNHTEILPNHNLQVLVAETNGYNVFSVTQTSRLYRQHNVSAIIGPPFSCVSEAKIAGILDRAMISYYCSDAEVSNKKEYPTFARTKSTDSTVATSLIKLLKHYNWLKVTIITDDFTFTGADWKPLTQEIKEISFNLYYFEWAHTKSKEFNVLVDDLKANSRIIVFIGDTRGASALTFAMGERGLLQNGEYFIINVDTSDPYDVDKPDKKTKLCWDRTGQTKCEVFEQNNQMSLYFRNMAAIMRSHPIDPNFKEFNVKVQKKCQEPPFNYGRRHEDRVLDVKLDMAASIYDATYVLARALDNVIKNNGSIYDGVQVYNSMKGRPYRSKMGYDLYITDDGDSLGSYTLYQSRESAANSSKLNVGIYPVALFNTMQTNTARLPSMEFLTPAEGLLFINGKPPKYEPECGFHDELCPQQPSTLNTKTIVALAISMSILGVAIIISLPIYFFHKRRCRSEEYFSLLLINHKDIIDDPKGKPPLFMNKVSHSAMNPQWSWSSLASVAHESIRGHTKISSYKGQPVAVKRINKKSVDMNQEIRKELRLLKNVRHPNLVGFIGACIEPGHIYTLSEYCNKGNLQDILENTEVQLDTIFIASLIFDIIQGMTFLHESDIHFHGSLRSTNCVIDSRWAVKLTGYGLHHFREGEVKPDPSVDYVALTYQLWDSPELLRQEKMKNYMQFMQRADVYSFAIVMFEICGRLGPFGTFHNELDNEEILERVKRGGDLPFRPRIGDLAERYDTYVTDLLKDCWSENPIERPSFKSIQVRLKPLQKGMKRQLLDNVISNMEKYAKNLEDIVSDRTQKLAEEKAKTDELLHKMLPKQVADQLKRGDLVEAEGFESVTVYFSDIVGFTSISSDSTPIQIVRLLNKLYSMFDKIIGEYDVYKVETIGDAYMVASGLPRGNGDNHAGEIASMSLNLLDAIRTFKIPHKPTEIIKLRIGIHTGPCVAGVVGSKMPRYCLFGDTVNTASRMESNGLPLRIHTSKSTKAVLDKLGGYKLEERGFIEMKGKGAQQTYWLVGEDASVRKKRLNDCVSLTSFSNMSKFSIYQRKEHHLNHRTNTLQKLREMPLTEIPETSIRQSEDAKINFRPIGFKESLKDPSAVWSDGDKPLLTTSVVSMEPTTNQQQHKDVANLSNNNVMELNNLTSVYKMTRSNHSSGTGSTVSLDAEMNIHGSDKTLNNCPPAYQTLEIDDELINLLTLNNHKVGMNHHKPKNYMRVLPMQSRQAEEQETCDKSFLLGFKDHKI